MKKVLASFKSKKFRYGAFSTFIAMFVVAILLMVNIIVEQMNIRFDMTHMGFFTLSDRTIEFIQGIDEDIRIYTLSPAGEEQNIFAELMNQYQANSRRITVTNRDPFIHRAFVDQFAADGQSISPHSIIVVSDRRHRVIPERELTITQFNERTWMEETVAMNAEPRVTNAIAYVLSTETFHAYILDGANHRPLPPDFISALELNNFTHAPIDLTIRDIPDYTDVLIITTPDRDITEVERYKLREWLELGGRAMFMVDITPFEMSNLNFVLEAFGVTLSGYYVFEGNAFFHFPGFPTYLFPAMNDEHFINETMLAAGAGPFVLDHQAITQTGLSRSFLNITPLLQATNQAWGRNDPENTQPSRMAGEPEGPFDVAISISDAFATGFHVFHTKMVVVGGTSLMDSTASQISRGANEEFFINSLNWLVDRLDGDAVFIPPRSLITTQFLHMNASEQNNVMMVALAGLPGVVAIGGLVVWLRRRNR